MTEQVSWPDFEDFLELLSGLDRTEPLPAPAVYELAVVGDAIDLELLMAFGEVVR